jgi:hypothetical protein
MQNLDTKPTPESIGIMRNLDTKPTPASMDVGVGLARVYWDNAESRYKTHPREYGCSI